MKVVIVGAGAIGGTIFGTAAGIAVFAFNGLDLTDVYKQLGETFDKTETEIVDMCRNGEISFEDFAE